MTRCGPFVASHLHATTSLSTSNRHISGSGSDTVDFVHYNPSIILSFGVNPASSANLLPVLLSSLTHSASAVASGTDLIVSTAAAFFSLAPNSFSSSSIASVNSRFVQNRRTVTGRSRTAASHLVCSASAAAPAPTFAVVERRTALLLDSSYFDDSLHSCR